VFSTWYLVFGLFGIAVWYWGLVGWLVGNCWLVGVGLGVDD
jgi:hypothetical protein